MPEVVIPAALIKATSKINESSSSIGFVPTTFRLIGSTLPPKILVLHLVFLNSWSVISNEFVVAMTFS